MRIAAIDFEASCLPFLGPSFPIEVGAARVDDGETKSWLIRPEPVWRDWHWDPAAEKVHGISRETLVKDGLAAEVVFHELSAFLNGLSVVSDAVGLDQFWLEVLSAAAGRNAPFLIQSLDSLMEDIVSSGGLAGAGQIEDAKREAAKRFPDRHRAGVDARRNAEAVRIAAEIG